MREIGPPRPPADFGEGFYVIRASDVFKSVIDTEAGPVNVSVLMGRVMTGDVGKRIYRRNLGDSGYIWQVENDRQFRERRDRERRQEGPPEEGLV